MNIDKLGYFFTKHLLDLDLVSWWSVLFLHKFGSRRRQDVMTCRSYAPVIDTDKGSRFLGLESRYWVIQIHTIKSWLQWKMTWTCKGNQSSRQSSRTIEIVSPKMNSRQVFLTFALGFRKPSYSFNPKEWGRGQNLVFPLIPKTKKCWQLVITEVSLCSSSSRIDRTIPTASGWSGTGTKISPGTLTSQWEARSPL